MKWSFARYIRQVFAIFKPSVPKRATRRKRWREEELLKGVTPEICGPDLIPDRVGRELI